MDVLSTVNELWDKNKQVIGERIQGWVHDLNSKTRRCEIVAARKRFH